MVPHGLQAWPVKKHTEAMKDSTHCTIVGRHGIPLVVVVRPLFPGQKRSSPGENLMFAEPGITIAGHVFTSFQLLITGALLLCAAAILMGYRRDLNATLRQSAVTDRLAEDLRPDPERPRKDCQPVGRLFDSRGGAPLGGKDRDADRRARGGTSKRGSASRGLLDFRPPKERSK